MSYVQNLEPILSGHELRGLYIQSQEMGEVAPETLPDYPPEAISALIPAWLAWVGSAVALANREIDGHLAYAYLDSAHTVITDYLHLFEVFTVAEDPDRNPPGINLFGELLLAEADYCHAAASLFPGNRYFTTLGIKASDRAVVEGARNAESTRSRGAMKTELALGEADLAFHSDVYIEAFSDLAAYERSEGHHWHRLAAASWETVQIAALTRDRELMTAALGNLRLAAQAGSFSVLDAPLATLNTRFRRHVRDSSYAPEELDQMSLTFI